MTTQQVGSGWSRRSFLRTGAVALALPLMESLLPRRAFAAPAGVARRMICINSSLGLHGPHFFPKETGRNYTPPKYLEQLKDMRGDFTVFSGLSHPEQNGADGHSSTMTWLTAARHPGKPGFKNSISMDQVAAEKIGLETRFPYLALGTGGGAGQSYTRSGVPIPAEWRPSVLFSKLFINGTPQEVEKEVQRLREGRSILDTLSAQAKKLERKVGTDDKEKLEEYYTSVRELEQRLQRAEEWLPKPKPKVDAKPPQDSTNAADIIGRMRLVFDLLPLVLQTDSTRLMTMLIMGGNSVPPVPGVTIDHHNLSHHGQDPVKIEQLTLIEHAQMQALRDLLVKLKSVKEGDRSLLDNTTVLFGSNLGNANAHDPRNLPILVAGGGFDHGQHLAFDEKKNVPLCNLFVQMLQQTGIEVDSFGSSTSASVTGFASRK